MNYQDKKSLRQTGRTTRMLIDAIGHWKNTNDVVVIVVASYLHSKHIKESLRYYSGFSYPKIIREFRFVYFRDCFITDDFHVESFALIGTPKYKVFFDHYALECKYSRILHEIHKYDLPTEGYEIK